MTASVDFVVPGAMPSGLGYAQVIRLYQLQQGG
jgi:hypothetical protein